MITTTQTLRITGHNLTGFVSITQVNLQTVHTASHLGYCDAAKDVFIYRGIYEFD